MSNTKLPSECSTGTSPTASTPCTQCGWPPTTRSAPARTRSRPTRRWIGSGRWVYCVPQCGSTTTTSARWAVRRTARSTRSRSACTSGPVLGGIRRLNAPGVPGPASSCLTDRVESDEPEPHATALDDRRPGRRGSVVAGAERHDRAAGEGRDGVEQGLFAVVACVVVRQRHRVEPRAAQRPEKLRAATERVATLGRFTAGGQGALQVADREVGASQEPRHRRQRSSRVRDSTAEHHVPHDEESQRVTPVADGVDAGDASRDDRRPDGPERYDGQGARVTFDGGDCPSGGQPTDHPASLPPVHPAGGQRAGLRASEVELRTGRVPDDDHRLGRLRLRGRRRARRCRLRGRRPRARALGGRVSGRVSAPGQHRRSCGEREQPSRHTSTLRPGATPGSGQRLAQVAGWTHAHTHDRRPVRCDR